MRTQPFTGVVPWQPAAHKTTSTLSTGITALTLTAASIYHHMVAYIENEAIPSVLALKTGQGPIPKGIATSIIKGYMISPLIKALQSIPNKIIKLILSLRKSRKEAGKLLDKAKCPLPDRALILALKGVIEKHAEKTFTPKSKQIKRRRIPIHSFI